MAHGNGPNGLAVVLAALGALGRLDQEHAAAHSKELGEPALLSAFALSELYPSSGTRAAPEPAPVPKAPTPEAPAPKALSPEAPASAR